MNYTEILSTLNQASAFDLYRLRAAIDQVLDQPGWMTAVRARLRTGITIEYFEPQANRAFKGQLLEMRRKQAVILNLETQKRWLISYSAINLDGTDVEIREQPQQGLSRHAVAIGDIVGFIDREQQQRSGKILRLNDKTVSLQVGNQRWRVAYALLHRVVDSSTRDGHLAELGTLDIRGALEGVAEIVIEQDDHE
ncbi:MAG: hypothetical protein KBD60_09525 [Sterolibacterium sp.]|jgi:hypothetical protein|nr:hypothetical protein [Sterolibacterium sp.]